MGRYARTGAPVTDKSATLVQAGTDNDLTDPRILDLGKPCRPCWVTNHNTNAALRVKVNSQTNFDDTSEDDGVGHISVPAGQSVEVSAGGIIEVQSLSFATQNVADDLDQVGVAAWPL